MKVKGHWFALFVVAGCGEVANTTPDAPLVPDTVRVTVVKDGTGGGTVTSSPSGVDCGATCVADFEEGEAVVLTAVAETGSVFTGWGGGCTGTNSCVFTANSNNAISATFTKTKFALTVTKSGTGTGSVASAPAGIDCGATCTGMFDAGSLVTLTATPTPGHNFRGWSGGACTGTGTCEVTLAAATSVNAEFSVPNLFLIDDSTDTSQKVTNLTTPALVNVGGLGVAYDFGDCAYNSNDGMVYVVDGRPNNALYRVNLTTGAATLVGTHGIIDMFALGYHPPSNTMYGIGSASGYQLYRLNLTTGAATLVAPTTYTNGLVWDTQRNRMLAITSSGVFNTIDLTTGVQTPIAGAGAGLSNNNGLTYDTANDLFWMSSHSGGIAKYDPDANFAGTSFPASGPHTCITYVP